MKPPTRALQIGSKRIIWRFRCGATDWSDSKRSVRPQFQGRLDHPTQLDELFGERSGKFGNTKKPLQPIDRFNTQCAEGWSE